MNAAAKGFVMIIIMSWFLMYVVEGYFPEIGVQLSTFFTYFAVVLLALLVFTGRKR